jgi:hypothetical protein
MAYTSGRTVKSGISKATTVTSATRDARRLVKQHLAELPGLTVDSTRTADPKTLVAQVRTVITFAAHSFLSGEILTAARAAEGLPGTVRVVTSPTGITITRNA